MGKLNGKLRVLGEEVDTWELAQRMVGVYKDAKKVATGNAETRKIARMEVVVKQVIEEFVMEVERAEQESV